MCDQSGPCSVEFKCDILSLTLILSVIWLGCWFYVSRIYTCPHQTNRQYKQDHFQEEKTTGQGFLGKSSACPCCDPSSLICCSGANFRRGNLVGIFERSRQYGLSGVQMEWLKVLSQNVRTESSLNWKCSKFLTQSEENITRTTLKFCERRTDLTWACMLFSTSNLPPKVVSWLTNPPFVRKWLPPLTDEKSCASTKPSSSEASQCLAAKNICDVCWHFLMILAKHEPQGLKKHGPNFQQNQMRCVYVRSSYVRYYSLAFLFQSVQMILACDGLILTFLWTN